MAAADERTSTGKAAQVAADRLRELISLRRSRPGDDLPVERVLAVQLGVSRSTLREGIRSLRSTGLLHARPGLRHLRDRPRPGDARAARWCSRWPAAAGRSRACSRCAPCSRWAAAELAAEHATARDVDGAAALQRPHRPHRRPGRDARGGLEVPPPHPRDVAQPAARAAARLDRRARQGRAPPGHRARRRSASAAPSSTSRSSRRSRRATRPRPAPPCGGTSTTCVQALEALAEEEDDGQAAATSRTERPQASPASNSAS